MSYVHRASRESLVHQLCLFHLFFFYAGKGANGILMEYILNKQRCALEDDNCVFPKYGMTIVAKQCNFL